MALTVCWHIVLSLLNIMQSEKKLEQKNEVPHLMLVTLTLHLPTWMKIILVPLLILVKCGGYAYYQEDATAGHLEGCSLLFGLLLWSVSIGPPMADVANERILLEEFLVPCVRVNLRFFTKNENGRH